MRSVSRTPFGISGVKKVKPSGDVRLCVDFCKLHDITVRVSWGGGGEEHDMHLTKVAEHTIFSIKILIGRAKRALHTSESQLRSDMYICLYHKVKVNACPFPAAMFKRQH